MILKLGMNHVGMELFKVCINHDPGMTLTYFMAGQLRLPVHWNGKRNRKRNRKMSFNGRNLARNEQIDFMLMKIFWVQGVVCPCPGAIYMYMTIIFKYLLL